MDREEEVKEGYEVVTRKVDLLDVSGQSLSFISLAVSLSKG